MRAAEETADDAERLAEALDLEGLRRRDGEEWLDYLDRIAAEPVSEARLAWLERNAREGWGHHTAVVYAAAREVLRLRARAEEADEKVAALEGTVALANGAMKEYLRTIEGLRARLEEREAVPPKIVTRPNFTVDLEDYE